MDLKFSKVTRKGPITIVTLSRPEVYNALHIDAHFELNKVFDEFSADPEQWVAIVTGGNGGIGLGMARGLADAGAAVAVVGRNEAKSAAAVEDLGKRGVKAIAVATDVTDKAAVAAMVERVIGELGRIDILVNNAGMSIRKPPHELELDEWSKVIDTNLTGVFNMTHGVWNGMRDRKFGRVINISSVNGQKGQAGQANYSAAKAGDIGFTRALAQEGARAGITVNAIAPGYIGTEMVRAIDEKVLNERIIPQIPVGRLGEPEEIARCVAFLAADDAGFITGSTISANGGQFFV